MDHEDEVVAAGLREYATSLIETHGHQALDFWDAYAADYRR